MADMTAFERQLAARLELIAGPEPHVDAMASARTAMTIASTRRPFGMFSALKFVAAAVIVALFGGFLLAGILTTQQDGEAPPAAVIESPSPMTTEELLSGMVTEEVEPGVFRVVDDGVRERVPALSIVVGDDGSVWGSRDHGGPSGRGGIFRLGGEFIDTIYDAWSVTFDGTLWADGLHTYDGERWVEQPPPPTNPDDFELHDLGSTVWATWPDPQRPQQRSVARLDEDEWRVLDAPIEPKGPSEEADWSVELLTTDGGDLWAWSSSGAYFPTVTEWWGWGVMSRWVDGEWDEVYRKRVDEPWAVDLLALGPDGTMWFWQADPVLDESGELVRDQQSLRSFDGSEWREWSGDDLMLGTPTGGGVGGVGVGPHGSLWLSPGETYPGDDDSMACHGLARFDGERWDRFLADLCTQSASIGPDGSVWTLAGTRDLVTDWEDGSLDGWDLYVITPVDEAAIE